MMRSIFMIFVQASLVLALFACSQKNLPSEQEITSAVAGKFPAFIETTNVTIEAQENSGTEVDPKITSRISGTITARETTFVVERQEDGVSFIRQRWNVGQEINIYGKTMSTLYQGKWRTQVALEGVTNPGKPRSAFTERTVLLGTPEEEKYAQEREQERDMEAKRKAEELRKQAERAAIIAAEREKAREEEVARKDAERKQREARHFALLKKEVWCQSTNMGAMRISGFNEGTRQAAIELKSNSYTLGALLTYVEGRLVIRDFQFLTGDEIKYKTSMKTFRKLEVNLDMADDNSMSGTAKWEKQSWGMWSKESKAVKFTCGA